MAQVKNKIGGSMENRIVFNGKEYRSVEEMPPQIRQAYEALMGAFADKDADGMPDLLQAKGGDFMMQQLNIVHEGQVYHSLEELPPEGRAKYQAAIQKLDKDGNGLPDFIENLASVFPGAIRSEPAQPAAPDLPSPLPTTNVAPVMEEVGINWKVILIGLIAGGLLLLGGAIAWILLSW